MLAKGLLLVLACACLLANATGVEAGDWKSCSKALKELNSATNAASFLTYETTRKENQFEESKRLHVLMQSITDERVQEYKREYQRHLVIMKNSFIRLKSAMFDAELACYSSLSSQTSKAKHAPSEKLLDRMCLKLKEHTKSMQPEQRLDFCKRVRYPGDCGKCLASK